MYIKCFNNYRYVFLLDTQVSFIPQRSLFTPLSRAPTTLFSLKKVEVSEICGICYSLKRLLPPVLPLMVLQVLRCLQHLPAEAALELWLLMRLHVYPQLCSVGYSLLADFALRMKLTYFWSVSKSFSLGNP